MYIKYCVLMQKTKWSAYGYAGRFGAGHQSVAILRPEGGLRFPQVPLQLLQLSVISCAA